jgi:hypothetical protein
MSAAEPKSPAERLAARFAEPVSGPTYTFMFKSVTMSIVTLIVGYGARVVQNAPTLPEGWTTLMIASGLLMALSAGLILLSRTTIDAKGLRRSGMWRTSIGWNEINHARYAAIPFAPRLLVVPMSGPLRAFHAGDVRLSAAMRDVAAAYIPSVGAVS